jgi:hypothetical protein
MPPTSSSFDPHLQSHPNHTINPTVTRSTTKRKPSTATSTNLNRLNRNQLTHQRHPKTVLLKLLGIHRPEVIEFDGRVYGSLDDEEEENFVPK